MPQGHVRDITSLNRKILTPVTPTRSHSLKKPLYSIHRTLHAMPPTEFGHIALKPTLCPSSLLQSFYATWHPALRACCHASHTPFQWSQQAVQPRPGFRAFLISNRWWESHFPIGHTLYCTIGLLLRYLATSQPPCCRSCRRCSSLDVRLPSSNALIVSPARAFLSCVISFFTLRSTTLRDLRCSKISIGRVSA
jgi:hypothetical protein